MTKGTEMSKGKAFFLSHREKKDSEIRNGVSENCPDSRRRKGGGGDLFHDSIKTMAFVTSSCPMGVLG
jgi:hypothetical protein